MTDGARRDFQLDTIIDPDGDVVFLVGTDEPARIQVSAKVLSVASRVFKVLLAPKFAEGRELEAHGTVVIPMPEDGAEALARLCAILHHRGDLVDVNTLDGPGLLEMAVLVDKYDCYGPVSFWAKYCYAQNPAVLAHISVDRAGTRGPERMTVEEMCEWVFIHKVFHEEEHIPRLLQDIVAVFTPGPYTRQPYQRLPQNMYDAITRKREVIIESAIQVVEATERAYRERTTIVAGLDRLLRELQMPFMHCGEYAKVTLFGALFLSLEAQFGEDKAFRRYGDKPDSSIDDLCLRLEKVDASITLLVMPVALVDVRYGAMGTRRSTNPPSLFEDLVKAMHYCTRQNVYDLEVNFQIHDNM